ncbi:hypothetical protein C9994_03875 [Marivirga lumbricoides]|uniref:Uncharacterized protein n=1 Tax=Marivirga lumbricoides TaxID=1046115 RepID=A0A2T4DU06_9BACT|nr:hypothetical protein C9994_03875 [Marivirga lumbricoides]
MKHILYSIIILFILTSCDPVFKADIVNYTNSDVIIQVGFDRTELEKAWQGRPYIPYLNSYPKSYDIGSAIEVDTANLIYTYTLPPDKVFPLEGGIGSRPDFDIFKNLLIITSDTTFYKDKSEIFNAFNEIEKRNWILELK